MNNKTINITNNDFDEDVRKIFYELDEANAEKNYEEYIFLTKNNIELKNRFMFWLEDRNFMNIEYTLYQIRQDILT